MRKSIEIWDELYSYIKIVSEELSISEEEAFTRLLNIAFFNIDHYPLSECVASVAKVADNNTAVELSLKEHPDLIQKLKSYTFTHMMRGYES